MFSHLKRGCYSLSRLDAQAEMGVAAVAALRYRASPAPAAAAVSYGARRASSSTQAVASRGRLKAMDELPGPSFLTSLYWLFGKGYFQKAHQMQVRPCVAFGWEMCTLRTASACTEFVRNILNN